MLISDGSSVKKLNSLSYKGYGHCVVIETSLLLVACKCHRVGHVLKMHQMDSQAEGFHTALIIVSVYSALKLL